MSQVVRFTRDLSTASTPNNLHLFCRLRGILLMNFFCSLEIDVPGVMKVPGSNFANELERLIPLLNSCPCISVLSVCALCVLIRFHPVFSVLRLRRDIAATLRPTDIVYIETLFAHFNT
jgi:hypothetical protein